MLQFEGNTEIDLLKIKVQAIGFIKTFKFEKNDQEKLIDLVIELTRELIFCQVDSYLCLACYKQEREKGLEVYVYNKNMSTGKAREALRNNNNLNKKSIMLDKSSEFLDDFELWREQETGIEVRLLKWVK